MDSTPLDLEKYGSKKFIIFSTFLFVGLSNIPEDKVSNGFKKLIHLCKWWVMYLNWLSSLPPQQTEQEEVDDAAARAKVYIL